MNLPFHIAKRYLFAKKSHNAINIISLISVIAVAFVSMSLVIVLSAFNGIENLVISLYQSFDSDIKITAIKGKTFIPSQTQVDQIKKTDGVLYYTDVLEEEVLLRHEDEQYLATIKGVEEDFFKMSKLDSMLIDGDLTLRAGQVDYAVIGNGIAYKLSLDVLDQYHPINVYVPKRNKKSVINPEDAFDSGTIYPSGFFSIQQDFDMKYMIVSLDYARRLLKYDSEVSAIELGLDPAMDKSAIQEKITAIMGPDFEVKNQFEQQELMYKTIKSEKLVIYVMLGFILIIAIFNSIGSLSLLIIEKKKDIGILQSMGAAKSMIRRIFFMEGLFISSAGALIGIVFGLLICWIQIQFEVLQFGNAETLVVNAYPVDVYAMDILFVLVAVAIISALTSWYPISLMTKKNLKSIKV